MSFQVHVSKALGYRAREEEKLTTVTQQRKPRELGGGVETVAWLHVKLQKAPPESVT